MCIREKVEGGRERERERGRERESLLCFQLE